MSRSIKIKIQNDRPFNVKQLMRLYNLSSYYATKFEWPLDKFHIGPGRYSPNWEKFQDEDFAWDAVNSYIEAQLFQKQTHIIEALMQGESAGLIRPIDPLNTCEYEASIRIGGNEGAARNVIKAVIEISRILPKSIVYVMDEGHLLYCPLILKKGKANLDVSWVKSIVNDVVGMASHHYGGVELRLNHSNVMKFYKIDRELRLKSLNQILHRYEEKSGASIKTLKDVSNLPESYWQDTEFFMRNVNLRSFSKYKSDESTILGGYFGEHWCLTDLDVELEGYKILSDAQRELSSKGDDFTMEIF